MQILTLETGLFPDQDTLKAAIAELERQDHSVVRLVLDGLAADDEAGWDRVVQEIMKAGKVITI